MKVYDERRMPSDGKSSHGLWPGELKSTKIVFFISLMKPLIGQLDGKKKEFREDIDTD